MGEVPRDILIVEDNPVTRRVLHLTLQKAGFQAREAEDGETALREIRRARPALVLLDLVLPDTHGLHLIARIREETGEDLPVVACSGGVGGLTVEQLNQAGFSGLLEKPVEPARLLRLLQSHLPESPYPALLGQGRRLLLVDHDETQRLALEKRLVLHRFEIATASGFREALERIRQEEFFAVLVEVQLPEQDGFDLVVAIRNLQGQAHLPVLLLSEATPEQGVKELALQLGATDLLSRTPARREIEEALARLVPSPERLSFPAIEAPSRSDRDLGRLLVKLESQLTLNASLSRKNLRLTAQLDILATLARSLVRQEELPGVLGEILEIIIDTEGFALGGVEAPGALVSPELCAVGDGIERLKKLLALVRKEVPPSSEEGRLLTRSGQPWLRVWRELDRPSVQGLFVVPLKGRNGEEGMLVVASESDLEQRPEGIQFVRGVAAQIEQALALRQAILDERRLLEQAKQQRKEALEQAKQLKAILASWKALVESVPDLILHLDLSGVILLSNRAAWGMTQQELVGKRLELLLPDESRGPWSRQFSEVVRGSEGKSGEVVFEVHPEEGKRWGAFHLGAIREGEEVVGVIVDLRDITQKKRSDEQALFADRMASVGRMAAGVAHEINNPLTAIATNLELCRASLGDLPDPAKMQELAEMLEDASQAAERVRLIVRDLKVFSRAEEEQVGPVDLQKVLDTSVRIAWNEIHHRARLRRDYHPVPPIQGHESRLGQAFLNLLLNAVQAIPTVGHAEENEILVGLREESGGVRVTIQDTGEGIAPEVMQHLFTPFFTTKPIGEGTGLGLSVCRQIVEKHRGEFSIESTPGQGTRVSILLPPTRSVAAPGSPRAPAALTGGRVLVVDDEPVITSVVRRILGARYTVETCQEAQEALARIDRDNAFDLILCDLMMPKMSGMDFHEELSRRHPEVASRVFFLTGGAFTPKTRAFLDRIPGRYLEKPFQSAELLRFVSDRICLALQRATEGLFWRFEGKNPDCPAQPFRKIPKWNNPLAHSTRPPACSPWSAVAATGNGSNGSLTWRAPRSARWRAPTSCCGSP